MLVRTAEQMAGGPPIPTQGKIMETAKNAGNEANRIPSELGS
jgi:hypothetical protein